MHTHQGEEGAVVLVAGYSRNERCAMLARLPEQHNGSTPVRVRNHQLLQFLTKQRVLLSGHAYGCSGSVHIHIALYMQLVRANP